MAFPISPINGEQYTNALGTTYQYYSADTAWKIVGGAGGNNIKGSGTANYLPKFMDTTTLADSVVSDDGIGNVLIGSSLTTTDVISAKWSSQATSSDTESSIVRAITGTTSIELFGYGINNSIPESGPDGTNKAGGVGLQSASDNTYMMINQDNVDKKLHLCVGLDSKVTCDSTGAYTPVLLVGNDRAGNQGLFRASQAISDPMDCVRYSVCNRSSSGGWTEDIDNPNMMITGKGTLDDNSSLIVLPSHIYTAGKKDRCWVGKLFISFINVAGYTAVSCGDILDLSAVYSDSTTATQIMADFHPQSYLSLTDIPGCLCVLVDSESSSTTNATIKFKNNVGVPIRITYKFEGCIMD